MLEKTYFLFFARNLVSSSLGACNMHVLLYISQEQGCKQMQGRLTRWMPLGSALLTSKANSSFDVSLKENWGCKLVKVSEMMKLKLWVISWVCADLISFNLKGWCWLKLGALDQKVAGLIPVRRTRFFIVSLGKTFNPRLLQIDCPGRKCTLVSHFG